MNIRLFIRGAALCLLALVALGASLLSASAQATQMQVLGGTLSWSTSSSYQPCGNGQFQIMQYTSFNWNYGGTSYPVNGSTAYIYNSPTFQCPPDGPQGSVGYTIPSNLGFSANCAFAFVPTGPPGGGTYSSVNCVGPPPPPSTATTYSHLECWGQSSYPGNPPNANTPKDSWNLWTPFDGAATGSSGNGKDSVVYGLNMPGQGTCGSLEITDDLTSGIEWNVLGVLNVCGNDSRYNCPTTVINNMEMDLQFVMPNSTTFQALEFDPDVTWPDSGGKNFSDKISVACQFHPSFASQPEWVYWDSYHNAWEPFTNLGISNIPCSLAPGRHRLQLYATVDLANHQYTYQEMFVDNFPGSPTLPLFNKPLGPVQACDTTIPQSQGGACPGFQKYIGVEEQIDNNSATSASTTCNGPNSQVCAFYDNMSLAVW